MHPACAAAGTVPTEHLSRSTQPASHATTAQQTPLYRALLGEGSGAHALADSAADQPSGAGSRVVSMLRGSAVSGRGPEVASGQAWARSTRPDPNTRVSFKTVSATFAKLFAPETSLNTITLSQLVNVYELVQL